MIVYDTAYEGGLYEGKSKQETVVLESPFRDRSSPTLKLGERSVPYFTRRPDVLPKGILRTRGWPFRFVRRISSSGKCGLSVTSLVFPEIGAPSKCFVAPWARICRSTGR